MKKNISLLLCGLMEAVAFYLLPVLIQDTGSAMLMLLVVMPLAAFFCAVIYGVRYGADWRIPILTAVLFVPTIFLFYNESAWIYAAAYGGMAAIGNGLGWRIRKQKK